MLAYIQLKLYRNYCCHHSKCHYMIAWLLFMIFYSTCRKKYKIFLSKTIEAKGLTSYHIHIQISDHEYYILCQSFIL